MASFANWHVELRIQVSQSLSFCGNYQRGLITLDYRPFPPKDTQLWSSVRTRHRLSSCPFRLALARKVPPPFFTVVLPSIHSSSQENIQVSILLPTQGFIWHHTIGHPARPRKCREICYPVSCASRIRSPHTRARQFEARPFQAPRQFLSLINPSPQFSIFSSVNV